MIDAFDWLWQEGAASPKMMTIGLHLRIIGRPARIGGLDRVLAHIRAKGGAWFARRDQIAEHWIARFGGRPKPRQMSDDRCRTPLQRGRGGRVYFMKRPGLRIGIGVGVPLLRVASKNLSRDDGRHIIGDLGWGESDVLAVCF